MDSNVNAATRIEELWLNARLATMVPGGEPYGAVPDGALAVSGGKILYAGPRNRLPDAFRAATRIRDTDGAWITPGLIDCHTHLVYGGSRAGEFELRLKGATYEAIARAGGGILSTVKATRETDEETLLEQSARRLKPLLAEGVTAVEIKSGYGLDLETELRMLRVARRLGEEYPVTVRTTFLGAHVLPPEYGERTDAYIEWVCREILPRAVEEGLADAVDGFCETLAFTPAQIERVFETARKLGLPVKLHAEQLSDQGGAVLAARYHALSADHLEYASEEGVRAMAGAGTAAVLLPGAFYFLRETRLPPVDRLRRHGVPMAVATDMNPGSSPAGSLLLMLNMACTLFRLTPEEALAGVTRNAARALGLAGRRGTLEADKDADFVLWDIEEPAELAYRFGFNPCAGVVKAGVRIR